MIRLLWLRWRSRRHDRRDINCMLWDSTSITASPDCGCVPCKDFGYPERRRMGEEFVRASAVVSSCFSPEEQA